MKFYDLSSVSRPHIRPSMFRPAMSSPSMSGPPLSSPAMSTPAKSSVNVQSCNFSVPRRICGCTFVGTKKQEMEKKHCDYFCCYLGSEKTKKEKTANNPRRLQGKNTRTFCFFITQRCASVLKLYNYALALCVSPFVTS